MTKCDRPTRGFPITDPDADWGSGPAGGRGKGFFAGRTPKSITSEGPWAGPDILW